MHSSFFNLFLGLLFQLDFYAFRGIDILPDVVGYYFLYKGLKGLAKENDFFALANKLIYPLIALSLVKVYNFTYHPELLLKVSLGLDIAKIILFGLNMYFIFIIAKGSIEVVEENFNDRYIQRTLLQRTYLFLGVAGILLVVSIISLLPFTGASASLQSIFTITLFSYILVILIQAAGLYNVYRLFNPAKPKPSKAKIDNKISKTGKTGKPSQSGKSGQSKRKR